MVTHHDQKQLGKRKVYFLLHVSSHNPSLGKVKAELSQELKRGSWRDTANWLAPLRANRTTNPGMALPRLSYTLSYQSSGKTWVLPYRCDTRSLTAEVLLFCNSVDRKPFQDALAIKPLLCSGERQVPMSIQAVTEVSWSSQYYSLNSRGYCKKNEANLNCHYLFPLYISFNIMSFFRTGPSIFLQTISYWATYKTLSYP